MDDMVNVVTIDRLEEIVKLGDISTLKHKLRRLADGVKHLQPSGVVMEVKNNRLIAPGVENLKNPGPYKSLTAGYQYAHGLFLSLGWVFPGYSLRGKHFGRDHPR